MRLHPRWCIQKHARARTHSQQEKMVENPFGHELLRITSADWIFIISDLFIRIGTLFFFFFSSPVAAVLCNVQIELFFCCAVGVLFFFCRSLAAICSLSRVCTQSMLVACLPKPIALVVYRHLFVKTCPAALSVYLVYDTPF